MIHCDGVEASVRSCNFPPYAERVGSGKAACRRNLPESSSSRPSTRWALAAARGITIEIAVYGGSCLILASDIRNASGDVDAVFLAGGAAVREIADAVAARLNLPTDWINEGVKRMAPPPGDPQPNLMLSGEYPRVPNSIVGLRVHLPPPAYILAMKTLANRGPEDTEKIETDLNDAVALMKVTKLTTEQHLVDLLKE
jgi:hypothetical protein